MDNPNPSELSNPVSPLPAPPNLAPPPCTTPDLAPHPVSPQVIAPNQAPVPDPTPNPEPVLDPTPNPAPVPNPTPNPASVPDSTPSPAPKKVVEKEPVLDPTPNPAPVPDPTPNPASVPDSTPSPAPKKVVEKEPVLDPTPNPAPVPDPTPNPASVPDSTPSPAPKKVVEKGLPNNLMYKNRLQEYTQKSSLQLPVYQTFNEGPAHMPRFRSTVWVDGAQYTSQKTFLHRKAAEQDAANLALESILKRVKDEECPLLDAETVFCKSILNEFAVKVNREKPTYNSVQLPGPLPVFTSTLVFDGVSYTGDAGRNKKEAEQLAARTVILSLLGNSWSTKTLYKIIQSKSKLHAALDRVKDSNHFKPNIVHVGVKFGHCSETTVDQEQEVSTAVARDAVPTSAIPPAASGMHRPHHDLKRPRLDPDPAPQPIPFPIAFEHSVSEQPLGVDYDSSSAKKRWKNKKNVNEETDTQFPTDGIPLNQASPCSVAQ